MVCCVLIELTVPPVNTLPEKTDTNDSMKVYKDPWVLMAAWNCAACQVKFFFSSSDKDRQTLIHKLANTISSRP